MNKAYERINWENYPSENTALNEANLNKMDAALNEVDNRVVAHETTKLDVATANSMVRNISFNESTGIFTVTYLNGSTKELDTKLEKIATNFVYDEERQKLILTLIDGTTQEIDMSALITQYEFENSAYISFTVVNGKVKAEIINGSITADKLQPNFLADVTLQANSAKTSEQNAKVSEENAKQSEINAKNYADSAEPVASTANGTNPTLENSTSAPFIMFKGNGATIQDGEPTPDAPHEIQGVGESGVLSVKSTGKNLCNIGSKSGTLNIPIHIDYLTNGEKYTLSCVITTADTDKTKSAIYNHNKFLVHAERGSRISVPFTKEEAGTKLIIYASDGYANSNGDTVTVSDIQIEKGDTATPYEPYTETTADIPLSSPLYDGDYIRYNMDGSGEESHVMGVLDLGDLSWNYNETYGVMRSTSPRWYTKAKPNTAGTLPNMKCTSYTTADTISSMGSCDLKADKTIFDYNGDNGYLLVKDTAYTDATAFKESVKGVKLVYEMAESIVTELTAEQIAEFEKLRTFDGTTHVTCEAESEISYFRDSVGGKAVVMLDNKVEQEKLKVASLDERVASLESRGFSLVTQLYFDYNSPVENIDAYNPEHDEYLLSVVVHDEVVNTITVLAVQILMSGTKVYFHAEDSGEIGVYYVLMSKVDKKTGTVSFSTNYKESHVNVALFSR